MGGEGMLPPKFTIFIEWKVTSSSVRNSTLIPPEKYLCIVNHNCTISFESYVALVRVENLKTTINNKVCITTYIYLYPILSSKILAAWKIKESNPNPNVLYFQKISSSQIYICFICFCLLFLSVEMFIKNACPVLRLVHLNVF